MRVADALRSLAWEDDHVEQPAAAGPPDRLSLHDAPLAMQRVHPDSEASMAEHAKTFAKPPAVPRLGQVGTEGALLRYKESSNSVNTALRAWGVDAVRDPRTASVVEHATRATSHVMPRSQTTFRGNRMSGPLPVGHRMTDRGFTGTSLDPYTATAFGRRRALFAIHAPPGARAYHIDRHPTHMGWEMEHLYHPDTHFEVIGHTSHPEGPNRNHVTHLAVVGQGRDEDGGPSTRLNDSPEGREWLKRVRSNLSGLVTGKARHVDTGESHGQG